MKRNLIRYLSGCIDRSGNRRLLEHGKLSPEQSNTISEHFSSSLNGIESNSKVRDVVMASVGNKLPGALTGLL